MLLFVYLKIFFNFLMQFSGEWDTHKFKIAANVDIGAYFFKKGEFDNALKYFYKAYNINVRDYFANSWLARTFVEKGEFKRALEYCQAALNRFPNDGQMNAYLALIGDSLGNQELVSNAMKAILPVFNNDMAIAYDNGLAAFFASRGIYSRAEYYCREALKINPNLSGIHYNLGIWLYLQNNKLHAKMEFEKALELGLNPKYSSLAAKKIKLINMELTCG